MNGRVEELEEWYDGVPEIWNIGSISPVFNSKKVSIQKKKRQPEGGRFKFLAEVRF